MFNSELRNLLVQVIASWQVLAVTGVLIVYIFLINYVARTYHRRPRQPSMPKKAKAEKSKTPDSAAKSDNDELGLEEAGAVDE